jgi:hypothetical protein
MLILKIGKEERAHLSEVRKMVLEAWAVDKFSHSVTFTGQQISTLTQVLGALIELPLDEEEGAS